MLPVRLLLLTNVVFWSVIAPAAHADRTDDALDTVWEATWDERGTPHALTRWEQPIRWRITGADARRHREITVAALTAAAKAAGLDASEAGDQATANVEIDISNHSGLADSVGCDTQIAQDRSVIRSVKLRLRASQAWSCVHHEVMHAMGVVGHPSGRTVLSYFPPRTDVLLELDQVMLAAWYDRTLKSGATPLEILWSASLRVVQHAAPELNAQQAQERKRAYYDKRIEDMKAFALDRGDVPTIIKRSGRASSVHIEQARRRMAFYLAGAYVKGVGVGQDAAEAVSWYRHLAQRGHDPSQAMLGLALMSGMGVPIDLVEAHRWTAAAVRAGNPRAQQQLAMLEQRMDAAVLEKARSLGPHGTAPAPAPAATPATSPAPSTD